MRSGQNFPLNYKISFSGFSNLREFLWITQNFPFGHTRLLITFSLFAIQRFASRIFVILQRKISGELSGIYGQ